jgi:dipeptidase
LETAGRQWAAQQVKDIRSISNGLTIGHDWDRASAGLVDFAMEKGWCKTPAEFSFRKCYSDVLYTRFSDSQKRQVCTTDLLQQARGRITPRVMMDVLQSHSGENVAGWSPDQGIVGADVCMHVGFGPIRQSQTVASLVSHLKAGETVHWFTGTASPCLSLFKPAWFDAGLPAMGPGPTGIFDPESLFWRHERLHRTVLGNYQARKGAFAAEQRAVQDRWIHAAARTALPERLAFSQCCLEEEARLESTWLEEVRRHASNQDAFYTRFAWNGFNREAMFLP